ARDAPDREQTADDNAAIEKIGETRRIDFERHASIGPTLRQKMRAGGGAIEVSRIAGDGMQVDIGADRVPGDLSRDRMIPFRAGAIVTSDSAVRFLNTGVEEPRSGAGDSWRQEDSLSGEHSAIGGVEALAG